jgi:lactate permease
MPLTFVNWLLALLPMLVVIILMLVFKWGGSKAGAFGWLTAVAVALLAFGADWEMLGYASVKSILLSLDVLYIIWTALLLYNIVHEAGAIRMIGERLPTLTDDRVMQTLLISWLLVSFLQGMGGLGVPIAICAPLLVGMGFAPVQAVVMSAIGHAWAVNFGSLASAFQSIMAVTGIPGEVLAPMTALLLGVASFPCGAIVAWLGCGWKGLKKALPALLILSVVMGGTQYLLATNGLWSLAATGAAIAGLLVGLLLIKTPLYHSKPGSITLPEPVTQNKGAKPHSFLLSVSAYIILVLLSFLVMLIPPVNEFLGRVRLEMQFPALITSYGWETPAGPGRTINIFGHPGALLLYTSVISFIIYQRAGYLKPGSPRRICKGVLSNATNASLGVIAMVGLATIMMHSGMTNLLARGLSESFSRTVYPALAPFIGALGAFITGSNNNSNVLFGVLQMDTASLMKLSVPLIVAAQTAGGSIGSVMSPAKVIVGCSTVGLANKEGLALRKIMAYGMIPLVVIAILTTILALK